MFILVNKSKVNQIIEVEIIQQKKEHQAIAQLILIVISHFIGYIPMSGKSCHKHVWYRTGVLKLEGAPP